MERFLVGGALVFAAVIALGAALGPGDFNIRLGDFERHEGEPLPSGEGMDEEERVFAATRLRIEDLEAVVTIIPEDRGDIAVTQTQPGPHKVSARLDGDRLVLDGDQRVDCRTVPQASESGPHLTIRTPRVLELDLAGNLRTEIGPSDEAEVSVSGCGPTSLGPVTNALDLSIAGAGAVNAASSRNASIDVAGSGTTSLGAVSESLNVSIAGSGDVTAAAVSGAVDASIAGSGQLTIASGDIREMDVSLAGSGNVRVDAPVLKLDAEIIGSGDVVVANVTGTVDQAIMGSGRVRIGGVAPPAAPSAPPPLPPPPSPPAPPKAPPAP